MSGDSVCMSDNRAYTQCISDLSFVCVCACGCVLGAVFMAHIDESQ